MTNDDSKWYVLRCASRQELKLRYELEHLHIECFVPLKRQYRIKGERRIAELWPAVSGLVFGFINSSKLEDLRQSSKVSFFIRKDCATDKPIVVSNSEMRNFIGVASSFDDRLLYLQSDPANWQKGQRVRVMGGTFRGYEGRFVRMKGDRRIVVEIPGVIAIATGFIHPSMVEPIIDKK